jgi:predicted DNA-binding protein
MTLIRVTVRIPVELKERLRAEALRQGCSMSQIARYALERYFSEINEK